MAAPRPSDHLHMLLATDRSEGSRQHLSYAARVGNALGARITLFHALRPRPLIVNAALDGDEAPIGEDVEQAERALRDLATTIGSNRPVAIEVEHRLHGRDAILAAADRHAADMLVLPTHARSGVPRAVLGSVAEHVLRRSVRPVLLLTDRMLEHEQVAPKRRTAILLATDLSPESRKAHRPAADLAHRLGLELHLLNVLPEQLPPPYGGGAPVAPEPRDEPRRVAERTEELRRAAVELEDAARVECDVRIAHDASAAIVDAAANGDYALLLLATHGRRGIARMVHGSVAEQVVRNARTPVLVMPARGA